MEDRRGPFLAAATALVGADAALLALVKADRWLSGILIALLVIGLVGLVVALFSYSVSWIKGWRSEPVRPQPDQQEPEDEGAGPMPAAPFTDRWRYTTEGLEAASVSWAFQKAVSHPGYMRDPYDPKPSHAVLVVFVPCAPLAEMPPTSEVVRSFLKLLSGEAIRTLIEMLGQLDQDLSWYSYASNGPLNNQAILARSADDNEAPVATAILNLNDPSMKFQHFQDPKRAELIVSIERRSESALSLAQLQVWFVKALKVPDAVAAFLGDDIGVPTCDEPAVHVGVELAGRSILTDLVDPGEVEEPPGIGRSRSFLIYLLADRAGKEPRLAAVDAIRGVCDSGLHVHGYEAQLDVLRGSGNAGT